MTTPSTDLPVPPFDALRARRSEKWRKYPADVVPLFVAEMDYALAPAVTAALHEAVDRSDTGYAVPQPDLGAALAEFAAQRWNWTIDPGAVTAVPDVGVGVVELLRVLTRPGDAVAFSPPVYHPFFDWIPEVGAHAVEAPLAHTDAGWRLDLAAIERVFATHPAAYVLCNPHNPVGRAHDADELAELVGLARAYRVPIVSDEIHGPLALPGATYTPLLTVPGAADVAVTVTSASKAWNLAGLKCASVITASPAMRAVTDRLAVEIAARIGHFGVLANVAAYRDGGPWLDELLATLDRRRADLDDLLRTHLPNVRWHSPDATYLAWLDCSALGLDDPAGHFLEGGRVALTAGSDFGAIGRRHVRLNFATSPTILGEAVRAMAAAPG